MNRRLRSLAPSPRPGHILACYGPHRIVGADLEKRCHEPLAYRHVPMENIDIFTRVDVAGGDGELRPLHQHLRDPALERAVVNHQVAHTPTRACRHARLKVAPGSIDQRSVLSLQPVDVGLVSLWHPILPTHRQQTRRTILPLRTPRPPKNPTARTLGCGFGLSSMSRDITWSGWRDSNPRPLRPERSALPNCATARSGRPSG